jgi:hypothetical protein
MPDGHRYCAGVSRPARHGGEATARIVSVTGKGLAFNFSVGDLAYSFAALKKK